MTYQPDTLTEAKFNALTNAIMNLEAKLNATSTSQLLTIANHASANAQSAMSQITAVSAEIAALKKEDKSSDSRAGSHNGFVLTENRLPFSIENGTVYMDNVVAQDIAANTTTSDTADLRAEIAELKEALIQKGLL